MAETISSVAMKDGHNVRPINCAIGDLGASTVSVSVDSPSGRASDVTDTIIENSTIMRADSAFQNARKGGALALLRVVSRSGGGDGGADGGGSLLDPAALASPKP